MSFEFNDVTFDESKGLIIEFASSVQSVTAIEADAIELQVAGVMATYTTTSGTAPDPVTTTRHTYFVPWTNVKAIRQNYAV